MNATLERAKGDKIDTPMFSRLEKMRKVHGAAYEPDMPEVRAEHLLSYLFEVGPTMSSGGYPGPLTHEELRSWQDLVGIELQPWEVRFLRRLSCEYIAEGYRAQKVDCPAPAREFVNTNVDVRAVALNLQRTLEAMAKL